jgi:hypothetical protein
MIRRGFWLFVGAAGGIMGYRRAAAATRQVARTLGASQKQPAALKRRHWARETIRFTRDVREGMDVYMSRHPMGERSTLSQSRGVHRNRPSLGWRHKPAVESANQYAGVAVPVRAALH